MEEEEEMEEVVAVTGEHVIESSRCAPRSVLARHMLESMQNINFKLLDTCEDDLHIE